MPSILPRPDQPPAVTSAPPEFQPGVLKRRVKHILRYWMQTEVHVFGFSIAANVLLSFFPLLIVIMSVMRAVFPGPTAQHALEVVVGDYLPTDLVEFIRRKLWSATSGGAVQVVSLLVLLFTANGVFEPLEVALNKAWGIAKNRSFVKNQIVSLGLIFVCGFLALASALLTGYNLRVFGGGADSGVLVQTFFKMAAVPISMLILFLIYWLLPNGKISLGFVIPPAVFVGLALEGLKYVNLLLWPWWEKKLSHEYGPFIYSVTIILWSFLASMLILAGAEWAAQNAREQRARGEAAPGPIAEPQA